VKTDKIGVMESVKTDKTIKYMTVRVNLSRQEKDAAKKLARSQGYFFSGWIENLIRKELEAKDDK